MSDVLLKAETAPATPSALGFAVYPKTDKRLYHKDDAGLESKLAIGGDEGLVTTGTQAAPTTVTGAGITVGSTRRQIFYTKSSGGQVTLVLTNGATVGQECFIEGTHDTDYLRVINGANIYTNGAFNITVAVQAKFIWGGTKWTASRNV